MTRDEKGRFVKGNGGGPGRKPRAVEQSYLDATMAAVSLEDWTAIVRQAVTDAKAGDAAARKWLSDYLLGLPAQKVEHSGGVSLLWDWEKPKPAE